MGDAANLFEKLKKNLGNGKIVFGFVSASDKGLSEHEYPCYPNAADVAVTADAIGQGQTQKMYFALCHDSNVVDSFDIPDQLKPFVLLNRAMSGAMGLYTQEFKVCEASERVDRKKELIAAAIDLPPSYGSLAAYITTVCYYNTNHNVGGAILPKAYTKVLRSILELDDTVSDREITRAVYLAGHAVDKRLSLIGFFTENPGFSRPQSCDALVTATFDSWAKIRKDMIPANTHAYSALKVLLGKAVQCGFAIFKEATRGIELLTAARIQILENGPLLHPGARYLLDKESIAFEQVEEIKQYIGIFGGFCKHAGLAKTITSVPQYAALIETHQDVKWNSLGDLISSGVEADPTVAKAAYSIYTGGSLGLTADPIGKPESFSEDYEAIVERYNEASKLN